MRYVADKWLTVFFFILIATGIMPLQAEAASDPRFFGTYSGTHTEPYTIRICAWPLNWPCYEESGTATFEISAEVDYRETRRRNGLVAGKGTARRGDKTVPFVFSGVVTGKGRLRGSGILAGRMPTTSTAFLSRDGMAVTLYAMNRRLILRRDQCGNSAPSVRPSNIAFGGVDICTGPQTRTGTVTICNTGNSSLSITSITIIGDDSFSILSETCPASLTSPGDSCVVNVRFSPLTEGAKSGTLRIQSNTPTSNVGLSGTGTTNNCDR